MEFSGDSMLDDVDCLWDDADFYWDSNATVSAPGKLPPPHLRMNQMQPGEQR